MKTITITVEQLGRILSDFLCDIDYDIWKELQYPDDDEDFDGEIVFDGSLYVEYARPYMEDYGD